VRLLGGETALNLNDYVHRKQERNLEADHQHGHLHSHRHRHYLRSDQLHGMVTAAILIFLVRLPVVPGGGSFVIGMFKSCFLGIAALRQSS
jgi:hypothetical protein